MFNWFKKKEYFPTPDSVRSATEFLNDANTDLSRWQEEALLLLAKDDLPEMDRNIIKAYYLGLCVARRRYEGLQRWTLFKQASTEFKHIVDVIEPKTTDWRDLPNPPYGSERVFGREDLPVPPKGAAHEYLSED